MCGHLLARAADPAARLRTAAGAGIGRLARAEWPERWPELLRKYVAATGQPAALPEWATGFIQSKDR